MNRAVEENVKILWISDIHFSSEYKLLFTESKFKNYFEHFRSKIDAEHLHNSPIDYVLISGDLGQSGSKEDYEQFFIFFLKPLLDLFILKGISPFPKIITIPGNHDVKWDNALFLKEYLRNIIPSVQQHIKRSEYLHQEDNASNFRALFHEYKMFFEELKNVESGKYQEFFFFDNTEIIVSKEYKSARLYGHLIDKKRKIVFILLNTAWFSLGDKFNLIFADEIINDTDLGKIASDKGALKAYIIKDVLKKKDAISEFSNQVTGVGFMDVEDLKKIFDDYPDFLIITCMHHPLNWLAWDEYYSYESDTTSENAYKLSLLLRNSDLLLTGHEHIPIDCSPEKIFNDTIHLKSGCFLFDNQNDTINLANSWFSFLSINTLSGHLTQKKYFFNTETNKNNWESREECEIVLSKKNDRYILTANRKSDVIGSLSSYNEEKCLKYIKSSFYHSNKPNKLKTLFQEKDAAYSICSVEPESCGELYIIAHQSSFYANVTSDQFYAQFEQFMQKSNYSFDIIRCLVLDLFVDGNLSLGYSNKDQPRQYILQNIVKKADNLFDSFRHHFFIRFEKPGSFLEARIETFKNYSNIKFVNHIIPYWVLEKNWL